MDNQEILTAPAENTAQEQEKKTGDAVSVSVPQAETGAQSEEAVQKPTRKRKKKKNGFGRALRWECCLCS